MADRQPEPAHLPVAPFAQDHPESGVESRICPYPGAGGLARHQLEPVETGRPVVQLDSVPQLLQVSGSAGPLR